LLIIVHPRTINRIRHLFYLSIHQIWL